MGGPDQKNIMTSGIYLLVLLIGTVVIAAGIGIFAGNLFLAAFLWMDLFVLAVIGSVVIQWIIDYHKRKTL